MARIAYGCSKLLRFYLDCGQGLQFSCVVDQGYPGSEFCGLKVVRPAKFLEMVTPHDEVYVFAVSNGTLNSITSFLSQHGFRLGINAFLYSGLFENEFRESVQNQLGWALDEQLLQFSTAYTLNSRKPIHTTICGTWLFLEALRQIAPVGGQIAEVGAYEGGNALCALQSPVWPAGRDYYIFDSFEGFPELSNRDPSLFKAGDYQPTKSYEDVLTPFTPYRQANFIRGFVPSTFAQVPENECFSLVFYDCDLYQPALDTFAFFWDRMAPGGLMIVHDYFAEPTGYTGVRDACDEFFAGRSADKAEFWQNTMAVFTKR